MERADNKVYRKRKSFVVLPQHYNIILYGPCRLATAFAFNQSNYMRSITCPATASVRTTARRKYRFARMEREKN